MIVGSVFMMCRFKSAGKEYAIANRTLYEDRAILETLATTGTTYSSTMINENMIGMGILLGVYSYVCYKLISSMNGSTFSGKQKNSNNSNQKVKTFSDIGGC